MHLIVFNSNALNQQYFIWIIILKNVKLTAFFIVKKKRMIKSTDKHNTEQMQFIQAFYFEIELHG